MNATVVDESKATSLEARYENAEKVPGLLAFRDASNPSEYKIEGPYDTVVPIFTATGGIRGSKSKRGLLVAGNVFGLRDGRMVSIGSTKDILDTFLEADKKAVAKKNPDTLEEESVEDILQTLNTTTEEVIEEIVEEKEVLDIGKEVQKSVPSGRLKPHLTQAKIAQAPSRRYIVSGKQLGVFEGACREVMFDLDSRLIALVHEVTDRVYTPPMSTSAEDAFGFESDEGEWERCVYAGVNIVLPETGLRVQVFHML